MKARNAHLGLNGLDDRSNEENWGHANSAAVNGVAEHAQAQAPPVLEQGGNAIEEPVLEHERSPASLPDSDADVPRGKIEKEDKPQHRHRQGMGLGLLHLVCYVTDSAGSSATPSPS